VCKGPVTGLAEQIAWVSPGIVWLHSIQMQRSCCTRCSARQVRNFFPITAVLLGASRVSPPCMTACLHHDSVCLPACLPVCLLSQAPSRRPGSVAAAVSSITGAAFMCVSVSSCLLACMSVLLLYVCLLYQAPAGWNGAVPEVACGAGGASSDSYTGAIWVECSS
jgi:hypothetical protein